ncbi:MAG: hypothetical protein M3Q29_12225 [Chloroflexota bacterium]|nr:hypothetical protein [Chloroflexota bacterium]
MHLAVGDSAFATRLEKAGWALRRRLDTEAAPLFVEPKEALQGEAGRAGSFPAPLNEWYHEDTLVELAVLFEGAFEIPEDGVRLVLLAILSSLAKPLSSQTKSWGHLADNVKPEKLVYKPTVDYFARAVGRAVRALRRDAPFVARGRAHAIILAADARSLPIGSSTVDLVVTSFPYPGMSDYALANRLSLMWFATDPASLVPSEIGARRKRFRRSALEEFAAEMGLVFDEIRRCLRPGGHLAVVGPAYGEEDRRFATVSRLLDGLEGDSLRQVKRIERSVPARRKRQSWGTLGRESITIWRKN